MQRTRIEPVAIHCSIVMPTTVPAAKPAAQPNMLKGVWTYLNAREIAKIPLLVAPDKTIRLTPGGQNELVREILEEFAPRFTPGAHAIYVGDTGEKWAYFDEARLAKLGAAIEEHGQAHRRVGRQRELVTMAHAAEQTVVTVERLYDGNLLEDPALAAGTLPGFYVEAVTVAERGAWPLPLPEHYAWDAAHLAEYARLAATDEGFANYLDRHVHKRQAA